MLVMMVLVAIALAIQEQAPIVPLDRPGIDGRGRDPWVFRCIFEDRTRMVMIAPAKDWWFAFNPEICAMHKVWNGKIDFRGKVWDFSQNNSRSAGAVFFAAPSEIWRLAPDEDFVSSDVRTDKDTYEFTTPSASVRSRPISIAGWQRVFLAFDETNRKSRFRVDILNVEGKDTAQWFESATSVTGDDDWQWNFKQISVDNASIRVAISAPTLTQPKKIRNVRMYGDQQSWFDDFGKPLRVHWRGYELIKQTKAVDLNFDVFVGSKRVQISNRPEKTTSGWSETLTVRGLDRGSTIHLRHKALSSAVHGPELFPISSDGTYRLDYIIEVPK